MAARQEQSALNIGNLGVQYGGNLVSSRDFSLEIQTCVLRAEGEFMTVKLHGTRLWQKPDFLGFDADGLVVRILASEQD